MQWKLLLLEEEYDFVLIFCKEISYTIQVKAKKMSQTQRNVQIDVMVVNTPIKLPKAQSRHYHQNDLHEEGQLLTP